MELNIKVIGSLGEFCEILVEEFIVVENGFNLLKFVVERQVLEAGLAYLEQCCVCLDQDDRERCFRQIKALKQDPC